jgi:hypothetical protein
LLLVDQRIQGSVKLGFTILYNYKHRHSHFSHNITTITLQKQGHEPQMTLRNQIYNPQKSHPETNRVGRYAKS